MMAGDGAERRPVLDVRRLASPFAALGAAVHLLASRPPFAEFPSGTLVPTLHGQIVRGHYLFALEGGAVRAFVGWALLSETVASRVLRTGRPPGLDEASEGDILWMLTAAAVDRTALLACVNTLRAEHAGRRVMGVRHRPDGRVVVFDQPIRPRRGRVAPSAPNACP